MSDDSNLKKKIVFYNKNKSHHQVETHMTNVGSQLYLDLKYNTITKSTNVVSF